MAFIFFFFIVLFFYLFLGVLGLCCCTRAFSMGTRRAAHARRKQLVCRGAPRSCSSWALMSGGSAVVAHGLRRSVAYGTFPDQGSNLCPLHQQLDSYPLDRQGSPVLCFLKFIYLCYSRLFINKNK